MVDNISGKLEGLSYIKRAALALREKQSELDAIKSARTEPIAIIGMGCRFPGAANPEAYWRLLQGGIDAVTEIPRERWDMDAWFDPDPEVPGKTYVRQGGFLPDIDRFEPGFFGISPREAVDMDPQQRLLLEVAWEALENAGQAPEGLAESPVGVFVGITGYDYGSSMLFGRPEDISPYTASGSMLCIAAGRVSYVLGLQGPTLALDTACSSSLVAIHLACQSLRAGESELAMAGGVNLITAAESMVVASKIQALSPDGRCKTFDASGDGFGRGEGCGIIVLKRLSKAMADGDNVLAVIRGSAIKHDGPSSGLTVPNELSQEKVIREALENSGITPEKINYVEAHGTGTSLGDPIEVGALGAIFAENHSPNSPLTIGSVKTNFGHLEAAAGIAGLMKIVLSLQHQEIPPHLHFKEPNPHIDWERLPFRVPVAGQPWPRGEAKRIAGVSSFGMSGTNAHVVLEEAPAIIGGQADEQPAVDTTGWLGTSEASPQSVRPLHLLTLSAKSEPALRDLAERYAAWFDTHPDVSLADVCFTAYTGRSHFEHRLAVVAESSEEARARLRADDYILGKSGVGEPKTVFLFTGQGSEYSGMGRQLYETEPLFRETIVRCDGILREYDVPLLDLLYPDEGGSAPELSGDMRWLQPVLFSLEYALAELWQSWGVKPDVVMGHSIGEYVAACVAGVFSLEDGLKLVANRGRLMQSCEEGRMLAVSVGEEKAREIIAPYGNDVSVATINAPESVVLSGKPDAIDAIMAALADEDGIDTKLLPIPRASHSPLMEPILDEFREIAASVALSKPKIALCSNVTGDLVTEEVTDPAYWSGHLRSPVRFAKSIQTLHGQGFNTFLEIGPKPALLGMAGLCLPASADDTALVWIPSLREGQDDWRQMLEGLGRWHIRGGVIDWHAFDGGADGSPDNKLARRKVQLPTYPFQRQRYWIEKSRLIRRGAGGPAIHPLLERKFESSVREEIYFESEIDLSSIGWLTDHRVFDAAVLPGTGYLEMALAAGMDMAGADAAGAQHAVPLRIQNVAIEQALILPEEETISTQLVLSPVAEAAGGQPPAGSQPSSAGKALPPAGRALPPAGKKYHFQVFSRGEESHWTSHASGELAIGGEGAPPDGMDLAALQSQCSTEISAVEHYQACRERGLNYGPGFQGVMRFFRGEGMVLGELALPESLTRELGDYRLHPALLDAAFQTTLWAMSDESSETYMPVGIKELQVYGPVPPRCWALARVASVEQDSMTVDVSLWDEAGAPIAEVTGLAARRVDPQTIARHFRKQSDALYELAWREQEIGPVGEASLADETGGAWLILTDRGGLGEELAGRLEAAGNTCILVYADTPASSRQGLPGASARDGNQQGAPITDEEMGTPPESALACPTPEGGAFAHPTENAWLLDSADPAAFERLFTDALPPDAPPLVGMVYLWALDAPATAGLTADLTDDLTAESLMAAQHLVCGGALHLVQAAVEQEKGAPEKNAKPWPKLWLITRNAVAAAGEEGADVAQAPLWGLGRTIAQEHPELWGALIDNPAVADLMVELLAEIGAGAASADWEDQIAYRDGQRYVARLVQSDTPTSDDLHPPLNPDSSYLITGGLGGLGLEVAKWMVGEGARHLALTGRSAPSFDAREIITELEAAGAEVRVISADIADRVQVIHLLAEMEAAMPPLAGIIHAAGVLDDGVLREQTIERFDKVMAPKVAGGWLLHTLTREKPLDFFVCFSSMAGLFGSPGQANYAAANTFLDALAHHRRASGLPTLSIDWGVWARVGLTAAEARRMENVAAMGFGSIEREEGISHLATLMGGADMGRASSAQVAVSPMNWPRFLKRFSTVPAFFAEIAARLPILSSASFLETLREIPPEKQRDHLRSHIQSELNRVLGFEPGQPMDPDQGFTDVGMDSLMIVESRNRLQASLGQPLPSTLLFNYSTLDALVDHLLGEVLSLESFTPKKSSMRSEEHTEEFDDTLAEVKRSSEEELKEFLISSVVTP